MNDNEKKSERFAVVNVNAMEAVEEFDSIIVESKFKLALNGKDVVSLMCLPEKLEELAAGFLFTEGFITKKPDIKQIQMKLEEGIIDVSASVIEGSFKRFQEQSTLVSGCGGGVSNTESSRLVDCRKIDTTLQVKSHEVLVLSSIFAKHSKIYSETRGVHSTAIIHHNEIIISADDIGRHNSVDKVIGEALLKEIDLSDKMMYTTGRVSSEITIKAIIRRVPILVARSGPTALAVHLADEYFMTLIGFARGGRMKIFTHPDRVVITST